MRVLTVGNMYPPHHLGGYELVWQSAVAHLRAAGHEPTVLTSELRLDGIDAADPAWVHRDLKLWWRDHGWPRFSMRQRLAVERHNARVLAERLAADRPDVVAWWAMGGLTLSLVERVRRAGLPAVGAVHDDWLVYGPRVDQWLETWRGPRRGRAGRVAERLTGIPTRVDYSAAATWLFVSDFTRRRALEAAPLARTAVAPSGIDARWTQTEPAPERPWAWRILSVGRIDPRKGVDTAVDALAHLPEQARLLVAGDGDRGELAALRERAASLGVEQRVEFLGAVGRDELPALYAAADAVVFPVRWDEPWGLVPLEAMACGRPVVATGRGGSAEYLRDGENCLLFEAGDAAALAARLERLARDGGLRAALRDGGARTAPRYTDARFNARLEEALREVAR